MDELKAGAHKIQETMQNKKAEDKIHDATDPSKKPSDRIDAAHDAVKADAKASEHACLADCKAHAKH